MILILSSVLNFLVILLKDGKLQLQHNILIIVGTTGQTIILASVLVIGASTEIKLFDILTFAGAIIGFGIFLWRRENAVISVIAINAAIVLGYIPLWIHLINGGATESLSAWVYITIAAAIGFQKPLNEKNHLALIYPLRSTITSGSVVILTLNNMYFWTLRRK